MKKFLSIMLLVLIIFSMIPVSSVFAYSDGLLNGKTLKYGTYSAVNANTATSTTTAITDNNQSTTFTLIEQGAGNDSVGFVFSTPVDISSYVLDANKQMNIKIVYNSGNVEWVTPPSVTLNSRSAFSKTYTGVTQIILQSGNLVGAPTINEFDVFTSLPPVLPAVPTNLSALAGNAQVSLSWNTSANATKYNLLRATTAGGPYTAIANNLNSASYTDTSVTNGITYYYVVTAANSDGISGYSNEASATPTAPVINRALLTITLVNGLEKEYDLSMTEVNTFINWYNGRAAGTGLEVYIFNKTFNLASFLSRKDYIAFSKIETFEVSEYKVTTP